MTDLTIFWIAYGVIAIPGLLYPATIVWHLRKNKKEALRWIQNDPGLVVNLTLLTPLAAGITAAKGGLVPPTEILNKGGLIGGLVLATLLVMAFWQVLADIRRTIPSPVQLKDYRASLAMEVSARPKARKGAEDQVERIRQDYKRAHPPFRNLADVFRGRGSLPARVEVLLNFLCALFLSLFFWIIVVRVIYSSSFSSDETPWLVLAAITLLLWFPLRVYSEWYRAIETVGDLSRYGAYWFLLFVGVCAILLVTVLLVSERSIQITVAALSLGVSIFSLLVKFRPNLFGYPARIVQEMHFGTYLSAVAIAYLTFLAIVIHLLGGVA